MFSFPFLKDSTGKYAAGAIADFVIAVVVVGIVVKHLPLPAALKP